MQAPSRGDPLRTLVLNAGYDPLAVVSFKRALVLVLTEKAVVVASDDDNPVHGIGSDWERPSVILLRRYVRVPSGRSVPVSRRGVLRRDDQRCAYCGVHASTIDHVIPRSRGGADSWENLVACCLRCNNIKGDRTPREMGWTLRFAPRAPHGTAWLVRGVERAQPEWREFLAPAA
jgi:5-methylcytosine-specific restriction endonuclease McrA